MTLTIEQLKQLSPEQENEYKQGISDYINGVTFNPEWSETRKEAYRDAHEEVCGLISLIYDNYNRLAKAE